MNRALGPLAGIALLLLEGMAAAGSPRIVNGLDTHDFPTTGALLYGTGGAPIDADNATVFCTGTLIGCRTFLTAAHCVASDPDPTHYWVYLQHGGIAPVAAVAANPGYTGLGGNDVGIVTLAADVTGITPTPINATHDLATTLGLAGTIVGFGQTSVTGRDFGIKRYGAVQTATCVGAAGGEGNDKLVCWDFAIPVGPPGQDSDTCNGDSGGPLFVDFGGVTEVVGVTSSGSSPFCRPLDHSWDASVYFNAAWIQSRLGTDSTAACGAVEPVGSPSATVVATSGALGAGHLSDTFTVDVPAAPSVLRVALNGQSNAIFNPDVFVKAGPGASPTSYDCKADGLSTFGACEFLHPVPGTWSVFVSDACGAGLYQVTTTILAAVPSPGCGNGVVDVGEQCDDGAANGTTASCCDATCLLQPASTPCADDGNVCTLDVCDGSSPLCGHPAGNPGAVCRPAADACDVADTCDGTTPSCPADARLPDTDGDGMCDAIDPCTNVGHSQDFLAASRPKITLAKINADPTLGNDTLTLSGAFQLATADTFAGLAPAARGARLIVQSSFGATRIDVPLAAGSYGGKGTRGWTANRLHTLWKFRDGTASPAGGIVSVQVRDLSRKAPREVGIKIAGKRATYPVVAGDEPVQVTVVLGNAIDAAAGACAESAFTAGECAFNRKGDALACKR